MGVRVIPVLLVLLTLLLPGAWGQQPQQPEQPAPPQPPAESTQSIRQNVNLVNVLFTVLNKQNKIIADLTKDNFKAFDDNVEQDIRFFSHQMDLPLRVGLLLDTSNSIRDRLKFEQDAAINFLFNVIRRNKDQAFLMTVDDQPEMIQDFTGDLDRLRDVILKQRAGGGTALYDAIYNACQQLLKVPAPAGDDADLRRVLVVISDGDDNLSRHSRGEALEMAQRVGIVIYAISTSVNWIITDQETNSSNSANRKYLKDEGDRVLDQFSNESGGRAFFPYHVDDLGKSFLDIGDELRSQYSLAYVPSHPADGKFHKIRVDVNEKGLQVRARKGYYATPQRISDTAAPAATSAVR
jgi:Ca-activated chloride channel family protein